MKYLKRINEKFSITEIKDFYTPLINWDLILDAKDMALEYIDKEMTLNLTILSGSDWIYSLKFDHELDESKWYSYILKLNSEDLTYFLQLWSPGLLYEIGDEIEFVSRMKQAYPNENIKRVGVKLNVKVGLTGGDIKSIYTSWINWEMIQDIKDMALEYIDMNMELNITILPDDGYSASRWVCTISFNHNLNDIVWYEGLDRLGHKEGIHYYCQLWCSKFDSTKYQSELISRIRESYPDENIV